MDGRWDTPENSSRQLFGIQQSTKHISWGYFWMMAISGFDLTVSAVVPEYLASCEQEQVFLVLALELVTVPPVRLGSFPTSGRTGGVTVPSLGCAASAPAPSLYWTAVRKEQLEQPRGVKEYFSGNRVQSKAD